MVNLATYKINTGSVAGWLNGLLGVIIFSGSLPATKLAVIDINPFFLTFLRASIAGLLATILIFGFRQQRPHTSQMLSLIVVSLGVVVGFPLLTAGVTTCHIRTFNCILGASPTYNRHIWCFTWW
ncbi:EamA family transporter [Vibrio parahaemolyticus]|nr:EamA family transporter [Vibrio parahaemolyticus]ELB2200225.1 EamA family transporter [Vibrio parahaemolyticus]